MRHIADMVQDKNPVTLPQSASVHEACCQMCARRVGAVLIGEGDLSQELGVPRQYEHPTVVEKMDYIVKTCTKANVPVGHPHVDSKNVERVLQQGYRILMPAPVRSYAALEKGLQLAGRT